MNHHNSFPLTHKRMNKCNKREKILLEMAVLRQGCWRSFGRITQKSKKPTFQASIDGGTKDQLPVARVQHAKTIS
jgi:hypothetical protein